MRFVLTSVIALLLQLPSATQSVSVEIVRIPSGDTIMFGSMFAGEGVGARPTIILLHGHPGSAVVGRLGTEQNVLQLAQPLQRAGFNVVAFNFRGAWGSPGTYGMMARIEDVRAALAFTRSRASRYNVDLARLMVVGWSMGGFNALVAGVEDQNIACTIAIAPANYGARRVARLRQNPEPVDLDEPDVGLSGYTGREQRREILANQPRFDVATRMAPLRGHPLLIVQARQDETVPADDVSPYVDAARAVGAAPFDHVVVDTNHSFTLGVCPSNRL